jgi:hypothetical protein
VVGVIIIALPIPLIKGYISGLAVKHEFRNRGIGAQLMKTAEQRIFRESPNVFLCVSSFNQDAKRFYERMGYHVVGELREFAIANHSEILMRKTTGPWSTFVAVWAIELSGLPVTGLGGRGSCRAGASYKSRLGGSLALPHMAVHSTALR